MPIPIIAAALGALGSIGGAAGAAGAAGGAAGAAGGAGGGMLGGLMGGAGGGGAAGGMMGKGGLMSMMGGGGGQGGGGGMGGMMKMAMDRAPHKKSEENRQAVQRGLVNMFNAQDGMSISPELFSYFQKLNGQEQAPIIDPNQIQALGSTTGEYNDQISQNARENVMAENNPTVENPINDMDPNTGGGTSGVTGANPDDMKTNIPGQGEPVGKGGAGMVSSLMGTVGHGEYTQDATGKTQVTESSDVLGSNLAKVDPKDPKTWVAAGVGYVAGKVQQRSELRRREREDEQAAADFQRQQSQSSAYADPNSVYYSAKDGAPIKKDMMNKNNNNLVGMMQALQQGGEVYDPKEHGDVETEYRSPVYEKKFENKSFHETGKGSGKFYTDAEGNRQEYQGARFTVGDRFRNLFMPNQDRVVPSFQQGGGVGAGVGMTQTPNQGTPTFTEQVYNTGADIVSGVQKGVDYTTKAMEEGYNTVVDYAKSSIRDMMTVPIHNPYGAKAYKSTKTAPVKGKASGAASGTGKKAAPVKKVAVPVQGKTVQSKQSKNSGYTQDGRGPGAGR